MLNWAGGRRAREEAAGLSRADSWALLVETQLRHQETPGGWSLAVRPQCPVHSILYRKPPSLLGLSNGARG